MTDMSSTNPGSYSGFSSGTTRYPDYEEELGLCKQFMSKDPDMREELQNVANRTEAVITVDLLSVGQIIDTFFVERIQNNVLRYVELFGEAASSALENIQPEEEMDYTEADTLDIFIQHRKISARIALQENDNEDQQNIDINKVVPKELQQRFEIKIISSKHPVSIREIKSKNVGQLISVTGIVTRITKVKPHVRVATYACDKCEVEVYQIINTPEFMPLTVCNSPACKQLGTNAGQLTLGTRGSKFIPYQEIRVQELSDQVPAGHIPRSLVVKAHGSSTRQCGPGDVVQISGVFLPTPYHGFAKLRAGLLSDTYVEAMSIDKEKKTSDEETATPDQIAELQRMAQDSNCYDILSQSIAPAIYGHEDVKKALLLLLIGGASRDLPDGMKIRGDINVCLMGDPGVAKSQLLKFITRCAPRAVYTTGKGSSGVGLTAAVHKDPATNEFVLEGGALVLADKGICCIDEFDKMEDGDRTAIHEVMEQQTVSIAKAGIMTTLNARTSVLAAANPLYGRYNRKKSASENINLPAALLSRFDVLWLIIDEPNLDDDLRLARHIAYVHQNCENPPLEFDPKDANFIRRYIALAKSFDPYVPNELTEFITERYVAMRAPSASNENSTHTTARTLLAILRLSTAMARLHFRDVVTQEDVDEAIRLMHMSKASLLEESHHNIREKLNPVDAIYRIVRNSVSATANSVAYDQVLRLVCASGYKPDQLVESLEEYEEMNVLKVDAKRTKITFI